MVSKTPNSILMKEARQALSGKWGLAVGTFLLAMVLSIAASIIPAVGPLLIGGPLAVGMAFFALKIARNKEAKLEHLFKGFEHFGTSVVTYLLMSLFILLGILCFIIPGIILSFMFSQSLFIVADHPTIKPMDALRRSRDMMDGNKTKLLTLYLRFFALGILCLFTLGIGFFWLLPYMQVTLAKFYEEVSGKTGMNTNALNSPLMLEGTPDWDTQILKDEQLRRRYDE